MKQEIYRHTQWLKEKANFLRAVKSLGGKCEICKEDSICVLDFHHKDPNEKEIMLAQLLRRKGDWSVVERELEKCQLLCSNCHRKEHFDNEKYEKYRDEIERRADGWKPLREIVLRRFVQDEEDLFVKLYNEGYRIEQISRTLSRTTSVIRRLVDEYINLGIISRERNNLRKRKKPIIAGNDQVLTLWKQGKSATLISSILNISIKQAYRVIREEKMRNG